MGKFNRKLSQLEATYQIAGPVLKEKNPAVIAAFIKTVFENSSEYGLGQLTRDWFSRFSSVDSKKATNFVHNLLQENEQLVSKKSILEGIAIYNMENSNGET